jgi:hypothetical protein
VYIRTKVVGHFSVSYTSGSCVHRVALCFRESLCCASCCLLRGNDFSHGFSSEGTLIHHEQPTNCTINILNIFLCVNVQIHLYNFTKIYFENRAQKAQILRSQLQNH